MDERIRNSIMASVEKQLMYEIRKHWLSLGVALASSLGTQGVAADGNAVTTPGDRDAVTLARAGGEGEGAGEGEGEGEGEGASSPEKNLQDSDVAYLSRLGLIRGHLLAGFRLYEQGQAEQAQAHMNHPEKHLLSDLKPALNQRDAEPFRTELSALTRTVNEGSDPATVEQAYQQVDERLRAAEARAQPSLKEALLSVKNLVRTAGEQYAAGVPDGDVARLQDYQAAWGFTQLAQRRLDNLDTEKRETAPEVVSRLEQVLADLDSLWPELNPADNVDGDAARLFGAAARIEIAALDLS